jgi:1,4-alpha-glucan branching enzyme
MADPRHRGVQQLVRDLNRFYAAEPGLHAEDDRPSGFRWVIGDDRAQSVFAFLRLAEGAAPVLVVSNFTPVPRHGYRIGVPVGGMWQECINSDAADYGGSGMGNAGAVWAEGVPSHGEAQSLLLTLPPLSTIMLRPAG